MRAADDAVTDAPARDRPSRPLVYLFAAACAAASALVILRFGMVQFGGEDGGIAADIAYMGRLGYRAYTEIEATGFPPVFVLGLGWAFRLLGARWASLVAFAAVFSAVTLVAQTWLGERAGFGRGTALLLAVSTQAATMLPLSAWGYNQTTSVLAALYLTAALGFATRPSDRASRVALVTTAAAIAWAKPNVAGLLLVFTLVVFGIDRRTRRPAAVLLVCAAVLSFGALLAAGADPVDVIRSYLTASSRMTPASLARYMFVNDWIEVVVTLGLLAPAAWVGLKALRRAVARRRERGPRLTVAMLAGAGAATGLVAMATNNDHNLVDTPLILIGCVALARLVREDGALGTRRAISIALAVSLLGLSAAGAISALIRYRVYTQGPGFYWEDARLEPVGGPPMMADVKTGPAFRSRVDAVGEILRLNPSLKTEASVFFGPRLLVMYPEWGIAPPKGLPTWWGLYRDGMPRTAAAVALLRAHDYRLMVFLHRDYSFYPEELKRALRDGYDVYDWRGLTLHVRKGSGLVVPVGYSRASAPSDTMPEARLLSAHCSEVPL